eukprot:TRINITY_DN123606_c0_g1_i1.p1 TRINITY_DN123606_c0_g1~~TRINITY_DN123606_c0_g1_i1.p1  ORF type:complete len:261 (+),score=21.84 TRINITY_DN123606_c0_g1_i1:34-783(+)
MTASTKRVLRRAFGEHGVDLDEFLDLCRSAFLIRAEDASWIFRQLDTTGDGRLTIKQADVALDRIAALRLAHPQEFAAVCARMVRDRDFRSCETHLSIDTEKEAVQTQPARSFGNTSDGASTEQHRRLLERGIDVSARAQQKTSSASGFDAAPARATTSAASTKVAASASLLPQKTAFQRNAVNVLRSRPHKAPWGEAVTPEPDLFFADQYYPGIVYERAASEVVETQPPPVLSTSQLLRELLAGQATR